MSRSLKVAPRYIKRVKDSLRRNGFPSQKALAKDSGISYPTISNFLNGNRIDFLNFQEICRRLALDWQEIADKSENIPKDDNFVGREKAIAEINHRITNENAKIILIHAAGGVGKTELARHYLKTNGFDVVLELLMAKETENITSVESIIEEWVKNKFNREPGQEFGITLERLKEELKTRKVGILIDNLEPALENGKFIKHRKYVELLGVLSADVNSVTLITSREKLAESGININCYTLAGLDEAAWKEYFTNQGLIIDSSILKTMRDAYGGNAKAMTILCGAIKEDYDGNMAAYWRQNQTNLLVKTDLEDLVKTQFQRLESHNPDAYRLLCRLGCFRYQDIATVTIEGVKCLLWDVDDDKKLGVIEQLKNRCLVEHKNGEYWLHPVIKQQAISIMKSTKDWEEDWNTANRKAADFWTESVKTVETIDDALTAFEAYYHYLAIEDYEKVGDVIAKDRKSKWTKFDVLGASFYRLGLLQKMRDSIRKIYSRIEKSYCLARLYNILGDLYWLLGNLEEAIKIHEKSEEVATYCLNKNVDSEMIQKLKTIKVVSSLNKSLCYLDLGEFEQTIKFIKEYQNVSNSINFIDKKDYSLIYCVLAACYSYLGNEEQATINIEKASVNPESLISLWSQGYSLLYLGLAYKNLHKIDEAKQMYEEAIEFSEETKSLQVKAKALTGLGEIDRIQREYETAIPKHQESIQILEDIGAKCDLAEAYYQLALTYQDMGETAATQDNFNKAIQLFREINAPKQIERVKLMINHEE